MEQAKENAALEEILRCREERVQRQTELLERFGRPIISFTVNMPGPVKLCPESRFIHKAGIRRVSAALSEVDWPILRFEAQETCGGPEAFFAVDANEEELKELMCGVEDASPLGRLLDLDVISPRTRKSLTRESVGRARRTCLLCNEAAAICARSRRHSVEELLVQVRELVARENGGVLPE